MNKILRICKNLLFLFYCSLSSLFAQDLYLDPNKIKQFPVGCAHYIIWPEDAQIKHTRPHQDPTEYLRPEASPYQNQYTTTYGHLAIMVVSNKGAHYYLSLFPKDGSGDAISNDDVWFRDWSEDQVYYQVSKVRVISVDLGQKNEITKDEIEKFKNSISYFNGLTSNCADLGYEFCQNELLLPVEKTIVAKPRVMANKLASYLIDHPEKRCTFADRSFATKSNLKVENFY
jgi:hypothetical protein